MIHRDEKQSFLEPKEEAVIKLVIGTTEKIIGTVGEIIGTHP